MDMAQGLNVRFRGHVIDDVRFVICELRLWGWRKLGGACLRPHIANCQSKIVNPKSQIGVVLKGGAIAASTSAGHS